MIARDVTDDLRAEVIPDVETGEVRSYLVAPGSRTAALLRLAEAYVAAEAAVDRWLCVHDAAHLHWSQQWQDLLDADDRKRAALSVVLSHRPPEES